MPEKFLLDMLSEMSIKEKEQLVKKIEQTACDNERIYYGCSRSVLNALQLHLNIGDGSVIKASVGLAGGVARNGNVCGALTGGIMAIGLIYGEGKLDFPTSSPYYTKLMEYGGKLYDRFEKEFNGVTCRDVQKTIHGKSWNLRNPEELQQFVMPEIHDRCSEVTRKAARLAAEVILGLA